MLSLTDLNRIIIQKQEEHKQELLKKFLSFHNQVEEGILSIAAQGKRTGEIVVTTDEEIKTHEIEELLKNHYCPISFSVTHNQTHSNPKERTRSYFIVEIIIPKTTPRISAKKVNIRVFPIPSVRYFQRLPSIKAVLKSLTNFIIHSGIL